MIDVLEWFSLDPTLVVGTVALFALVGFLLRGGDVDKLFGPEKRFFNPIRRAFVPFVVSKLSENSDFSESYVTEKEYVGTYHGTLEELETALHSAGFVRYPAAALPQTEDGRSETASWAYHERLWSKRQTHVRIFDARPESSDSGMAAWDLYAHEEYSAHNPLTMLKHYRGVGGRYKEAILAVRDMLADEDITLEHHKITGEFEPPLRNKHHEDGGS